MLFLVIQYVSLVTVFHVLQVPVEIDFGGTLRPKKGVFVKFIPRE